MSSEKTISTKSGSAPGLSSPGRIVQGRRSTPEIAGENCARGVAGSKEHQARQRECHGGAGRGDSGQCFGFHGAVARLNLPESRTRKRAGTERGEGRPSTLCNWERKVKSKGSGGEEIQRSVDKACGSCLLSLGGFFPSSARMTSMTVAQVTVADVV